MIKENGYEKIDFDQQGYVRLNKGGSFIWINVKDEKIEVLNGGITEKINRPD